MMSLPAWLAYVLPMAVYMLLNVAEGYDWVKPFYPAEYTMKCICVGFVLWLGWRNYPKWDGRFCISGFVVGLLGGLAWIVLCHFNVEKLFADVLPDWLKGSRSGYNPFQQMDNFSAWLFFVIRCIGLSVLVPLMEEFFWRGFLARFLIDEDFQNVPMGKFTRVTFWIVTLLFVAVHPEWTAAFVWAILINLWLIYTKNLWSCVMLHAGSNLFLGVYVLVMDWRGGNEWYLL